MIRLIINKTHKINFSPISVRYIYTALSACERYKERLLTIENDLGNNGREPPNV